MRMLNNIENALVSGGNATLETHPHYRSERDDIRELFIDSSLLAGPIIGANIGVTAATASANTLAYGLGGCILGAYAGLIVVPILTKIGLEMAFGIHDSLV